MELILSDGLIAQIDHFDCLPSTNTFIKDKAKCGAPNYYTAVANRQTAGRGRLGRSFYSDGNGLYMSFLLRGLDEANVTAVTAAAGVSAAEAIGNIYGISCGIKWVNDLYYDGKKVCGILAEAITSDNGSIDCIVVGIGINIAEPKGGFPSEIKDIAGAVASDCSVKTRNELATEILRIFYETVSSPLLYEKYRSRSFVIGRNINVVSPIETYEAKAIDIDSSFGLTVERENGDRTVLRSGEISIKI